MELSKNNSSEMKTHVECQSVEDFLKWYEGASSAELKANKRRIGNPSSRRDKNELKAIIALLA